MVSTIHLLIVLFFGEGSEVLDSNLKGMWLRVSLNLSLIMTKKKFSDVFGVLYYNVSAWNVPVDKTIYNRRQTFWDIVVRCGNFKEQNSPIPPPPSPALFPLRSIQSWCVYCFLQVARALHREGGGGKALFFSVLKVSNMSKRPIRGTFLNKFLSPIVGWLNDMMWQQFNKFFHNIYVYLYK